MASATGSHPDTGSSVRPLPGSSTTIRPARRPALKRAQNASLDRKRLRSGMASQAQIRPKFALSPEKETPRQPIGNVQRW